MTAEKRKKYINRGVSKFPLLVYFIEEKQANSRLIFIQNILLWPRTLAIEVCMRVVKSQFTPGLRYLPKSVMKLDLRCSDYNLKFHETLIFFISPVHTIIESQIGSIFGPILH